MAYEVLARKWRPRQFDDVVGQDHVVRTLRNAIESDRLAHAYLFVGPRGIGKTSIARIFSKALNCERGPSVAPCDACDACREIAAGTSLDVLEIDGASNNGVDQVRDLRETVKFAPTRGPFRIYIIDEVHMLSTAAFNALLKTLEEPPSHVKFMFATTEPERILPTIISRCQRFDLRRIPVRLIADRLELIAREEKITIESDAVLAVARGAEGGLRDAESALDQLLSFKGDHLTEEDVLSVFGLVSRRRLEDLAVAVLKGEVGSMFGAVGEMEEAGKDLRRVLVELLYHFRNLCICLNVENPGAELDLTEEQVARLREQAGRTDTERVLRIVGILSDAEERMRNALSRRTLLETALVRCARAAKVVSIDEILRRLAAWGGGEPVGEEPARPVSAAPREPAPEREAPEPPAAPAAGSGPRDELAVLRRGWSDIKARAGRMAVGVQGAIRDALPLAVDGSEVVIGVDAEFANELAEFREPRNRKAVEHAVGRVLGRAVKLTFQPMAEGIGVATEGDAPAEETPRTGRPDPKEDGGAAGRGAAGGGKSRRDWYREPAVQKTVDAFNGDIMEIRE